jgi:hypothetical protein
MVAAAIDTSLRTLSDHEYQEGRGAGGYLEHDLSLKQAALELGFVTEEEFDRVVDPAKLVHANRRAQG